MVKVVFFLKKILQKGVQQKSSAITHALVTTCINYCNVLYMASLWRSLGPQLVQNSATRTLIGNTALHDTGSLMTTWLIQSDRLGALQIHLESIRILEACLHCHDTCPLEWDSPIFPWLSFWHSRKLFSQVLGPLLDCVWLWWIIGNSCSSILLFLFL